MTSDNAACDVVVRAMQARDGGRVLDIFRAGLESGIASFETQVPDWTSFDQRFLRAPRLVAVDANDVLLGWAVLSAVSSRACYAGVAEVSIYVSDAVRGRGVGTLLLHALIDASEASGFWMLQGSIFARNVASLRLHQRCGFREVGRRERIACRDGIWHDTVLVERRSQRVGI